MRVVGIKRILCCFWFAVIPALGNANSYTAENFLKVWPIDAVTFEVIEARGEGARGIWCAAASYAERELRIDPTSTIYVLVPRGPSATVPNRKGVVFTLDKARLPETATISQLSFATTRAAGTSFPSYLARSFCRDRFGERDRWDYN
ncbi:hypothetical protein SuNHUV7_26390 (plasmid) [Pseudoseohaeicola sp. NH-UV-7]|nr:hypothetical protein C1J05_14535 [Sulfitobacter sp. JL08]